MAPGASIDPTLAPGASQPQKGNTMTSARHLRSEELPADPTASGTPRTVRSLVVQRPTLQPELLSFHLLSPKDPGPADLALLGEAYQCWTDVWKQTFEELDNTRNLPSDDFTRQDAIA